MHHVLYSAIYKKNKVRDQFSILARSRSGWEACKWTCLSFSYIDIYVYTRVVLCVCVSSLVYYIVFLLSLYSVCGTMRRGKRDRNRERRWYYSVHGYALFSTTPLNISPFFFLFFNSLCYSFLFPLTFIHSVSFTLFILMLSLYPFPYGYFEVFFFSFPLILFSRFLILNGRLETKKRNRWITQSTVEGENQRERSEFIYFFGVIVAVI